MGVMVGGGGGRGRGGGGRGAYKQKKLFIRTTR